MGDLRKHMIFGLNGGFVLTDFVLHYQQEPQIPHVRETGDSFSSQNGEYTVPKANCSRKFQKRNSLSYHTTVTLCSDV